VPPTIGRKNAKKLVELYGGKVISSVSKKTAFVVLGNDAGPVKLEKIDEFGLTTYNDEEFVALIEEEAGVSSKCKAGNIDGERAAKNARK
jgi:replication factor C subunit 1